MDSKAAIRFGKGSLRERVAHMLLWVGHIDEGVAQVCRRQAKRFLTTIFRRD